jgi:cell division cycle protein 20 (cofactor of APC complex)
MGSKWDIEKCTGSNDFRMWKVKMRAILTKQKCVEALKGATLMLTHLMQPHKSEMNDKAVSAIILCLGDNVLREVAREIIVVYV